MKRTLRRALPAMASAAILIFGAMTMSPAKAVTFVYVGNAESNEIYVLQLAPHNGDLTLIQKVAIPDIVKPGGSTPLAVTPDKRLLIAATRGDPMVAASYRIDPVTGKLAHIGNRPLVDSMAYIVTDRAGKYLLSASYPGHKVVVNSITPDGFVEAPTQVMGTEPNAHAIMPDPANRYVLVASLGGDIVKQLKFDAGAGRLSPNDPPAAGVKPKAGPRHFRFHPNGKLVYLLNELNASVDVFDYDADKGTLKPKQTVDALPAGFQGKIWAADIHLTPDGKFLYASERGTNTLAAFRINSASGTLALIEHTPTEQQPRGFAIDPFGRYLLAVGQLSHQMTSYRIDAETGKLTRLKEYPMGKNPNWIEIIELP